MRSNLLNADAVAKGVSAGDDTRSLVPSSWELVRRGTAVGPSGSSGLDVLGRGVIAYDLCADGSVVYSNGNAIHRLDGEGKRERLCQGDAITEVTAIASSCAKPRVQICNDPRATHI